MAKPRGSAEQFTTFGAFLKFLRHRERLTQMELSIAVGYSEAHISRLETGQRLPELAAIAALFIPALRIESDADAATRLMQLAAEAREPAGGNEDQRVFVGRSAETQQELPPTNLPYPLDRFIGRETELAELKQHLESNRLVTLVGPGGVGKTRLATELGWQVLESYPDGICFVQAAHLTSRGGILSAIAANLQGHELGDQSLEATLFLLLQRKAMLLILDNAEHIVADLAPLTIQLLETCSRLRVLVTSRAPLRARGEQVFRLTSLRSGERDSDSEAQQLFLERARSALPAFRLDPLTSPQVQRLCARLDGLPLAIELAAARLSSVSLQQLDARLESNLSSLSQSGVPDRHRTLDGVMDWSYTLLTIAEKKLLRKLSVFAGGWTLDAAKALVGSRSTQLIDLLSELVDKSLVVLEKGTDGQLRYRMLETVRTYAFERLQQKKEARQVQRKHALWCLALAEQLDAEIFGPRRREWLQRADAERANLAAALDYARKYDTLLVWRLAGKLGLYWHARGLITEALKTLEPLLRQLNKPSAKKIAGPFRAKVAWAGGLLYWTRGDLRNAAALMEHSIALWRRAGARQRRGLATALRDGGVVATAAGDFDSALRYNQESLSLWRKLKSPGDLALAMYNYGYIHEALGDPNAEDHYSAAVQLCRKHDLVWVLSVALQGLGRVKARTGKLNEAQKLLTEAQALFYEDQDPWGEAECLSLLGEACMLRGQVRPAVQAFLRCLELNRELGDQGLNEIALYGLSRLARKLGLVDAVQPLLAAAAEARGANAAGDPRAIIDAAQRATDMLAIEPTLDAPSVEAALVLARSIFA